jgi:hypothetical protein
MGRPAKAILRHELLGLALSCGSLLPRPMDSPGEIHCQVLPIPPGSTDRDPDRHGRLADPVDWADEVRVGNDNHTVKIRPSRSSLHR